jgi:hypothetical protein
VPRATATTTRDGRTLDELTRIWRVLALTQMLQLPRVAVFFEFMVDEIDALRPIITG